LTLSQPGFTGAIRAGERLGDDALDPLPNDRREQRLSVVKRLGRAEACALEPELLGALERGSSFLARSSSGFSPRWS
jgi:hypothetical protein